MLTMGGTKLSLYNIHLIGTYFFTTDSDKGERLRLLTRLYYGDNLNLLTAKL
jgi:hypothetical protein